MSFFLNAEHYWYVWHEVLKGPQSRYSPSEYSTPDDFIGNWEEALERRVQEAGESLSTIRGVAALVLGGGIGKGEPWPLSDIDVIGVYRHDEFERTKHEVRKVRAGIEERWVHEGFPTSLDIWSTGSSGFCMPAIGTTAESSGGIAPGSSAKGKAVESGSHQEGSCGW